MGCSALLPILYFLSPLRMCLQTNSSLPHLWMHLVPGTSANGNSNWCGLGEAAQSQIGACPRQAQMSHEWTLIKSLGKLGRENQLEWWRSWIRDCKIGSQRGRDTETERQRGPFACSALSPLNHTPPSKSKMHSTKGQRKIKHEEHLLQPWAQMWDKNLLPKSSRKPRGLFNLVIQRRYDNFRFPCFFQESDLRIHFYAQLCETNTTWLPRDTF